MKPTSPPAGNGRFVEGPDRSEIRDEVVHRGVAQGGVLLQEREHHVLHGGREPGAQRRRRRGLGVHNRVRDGDLVFARERLLACQHLVQHDAHRPKIRPRIHRFPPELLGRHVRHRPERRAGLTRRVVQRFGQPEIEDPDRPVRQQHHVARLQVAMDDSPRMRAPEPARDLPGDVERLCHRQRSLAGEAGLERLSRIERHCEEHPAVLSLPDVVDRAQVRMIERRGGARFTQEAHCSGGV